ncbi:hypothetical protein BDQ12DRAFT_726464 [Crucibulum laeve]|uniref:CBM1 domain-containing protein n=1 Tax=Crucibulum laeve TaxID=68775 RepID=A0A5C3LQX2_9AGAR|nr:hypothetical protein BDQ12DRAFT_726464 [Crucibulum laeve]
MVLILTHWKLLVLVNHNNRYHSRRFSNDPKVPDLSTVRFSANITIREDPTVSVWGQCGGIGYSGPTICALPSRCVYLNESSASSAQRTAVPVVLRANIKRLHLQEIIAHHAPASAQLLYPPLAQL